jgi:hypothetical protein
VFDLTVPRFVPNSRRRSRSAALVGCLALVALLSADWVAAIHGDDDDARHEQALGVWGTGGGTRVGTDTGGTTPEHCPICHWLRSLKSLPAAAALVSVAITPCGPLRADPLPRAIAIAIVHVPTRAPPAWSVPTSRPEPTCVPMV